MAKEDILINTQFRHKGKLLIDNGYSFSLAVRYRFKLLHLSVINNISCVAAIRVNSGQHLHQCRFPRPIFPDQTMDFPSSYLKIHIVQGFYARKFLGDLLHLQYIITHALLLSRFMIFSHTKGRLLYLFKPAFSFTLLF